MWIDRNNEAIGVFTFCSCGIKVIWQIPFKYSLIYSYQTALLESFIVCFSDIEVKVQSMWAMHFFQLLTGRHFFTCKKRAFDCHMEKNIVSLPVNLTRETRIDRLCWVCLHGVLQKPECEPHFLHPLTRVNGISVAEPETICWNTMCVTSKLHYT